MFTINMLMLISIINFWSLSYQEYAFYIFILGLNLKDFIQIPFVYKKQKFTFEIGDLKNKKL